MQMFASAAGALNAAPAFSRGDFLVLEAILGYDTGRTADLAAAGVLG